MMIKRKDKCRALDGKGSLSKQLSIQSTQPLHDEPLELLIWASCALDYSRLYSGRSRRGLLQSPQRSKTPSLILFRFSTFSAGIPPTLHLSRRHRHSGPANGDSARSPDSRWQEPPPPAIHPRSPSPRSWLIPRCKLAVPVRHPALPMLTPRCIELTHTRKGLQLFKHHQHHDKPVCGSAVYVRGCCVGVVGMWCAGH